MNGESKNQGSPPASNDSGGAVPSGFILKLYQMVNGAPDEVISWTPAGDAFIIGSDLHRLETETLPQFFRHNRFQSLVRQLNFYSFRKINRERNVWIYKHKLFHRDRPGDLHMVRRRTCPGVDGRRHRFSRFSARKLSQFDNDESKQAQSSDDDSSVEEPSMADGQAGSSGNVARKRANHAIESDPSSSPKRSRRLWTSKPVEETVVVDTSIVSNPTPSPTSVFEAHESLVRKDGDEDDSSTTRRNERVEMIEQSMVVSEVAMKLEEFARKAMRGRGAYRTRRGGAGVVTPPWGASQALSVSTRGLITYDDEYDGEAGDGYRRNTSGMVTDGDDSLTSEEISFSGNSVNRSKKINEQFLLPPVPELSSVKSITERILECSSCSNHGTLIVVAAVAGFCMTTPPNEDESLCGKVLKLIAACEKLAIEFQLYRSALDPSTCSSDSPQKPWRKPVAMGQKSWGGVSNQIDAVRDFKTFAVNCIHKVLGNSRKNGVDVKLSVSEESKLQHTADMWLKSVGCA